MKLKMLIAAALIPMALLTACKSDAADKQPGDVPAKTEDKDKEVNTPPSEIVDAVLAEIPMSSAAKKDKEDLPDFYSDVDVTKVDSASFALCGSGAYPDELAVIKCTDPSAAAEAKQALEKRVEKQLESWADYRPDEAYKLETAQVYVQGSYAILIVLSDNERAREIVDEKLAG